MMTSAHLLFVTLGLGLVGLTGAHASITLLPSGGFLKDRGTTNVPYDSGTLLVVASTGDNGFTTPSNLFNLTVGSAVQSGSDDLVLFKSTIAGDGNQNGAANAGEFRQLTPAITLGTTAAGTLAASNAIILYWFPGVASTSTNLFGGEHYGAYRSPAALGTTDADGSAAWFVPADGTSGYNLSFFTSDTGASAINTGNIGIPFGQATFTVVPEPSAMVGIVVFGIAAGLARRRLAATSWVTRR